MLFTELRASIVARLRRAKAARQLLAEIAAGKAKLDLPEADTTDSGSSGGVRFWSPPSRFRKMLERM